MLRQGDHTVIELGRRFEVTQPAISHHLLILRKAGLVKARRVGRQRVYSISPSPLQQMYDWVFQYRSFIDPSGHAWRLTHKKTRRELP
jgi:DNA-binding transcriptional ArsR family regulator